MIVCLASAPERLSVLAGDSSGSGDKRRINGEATLAADLG